MKPMKSDAVNYQKLIDNQKDDMEESQILNNYNLFIQLINSCELSPEEIFVGIQKLEIVYIQLTKERENPQLIFESLNSTGLDLTQADLIRNYLLMGQAYSVQEDLYNRYWIKLEQMLPDIIISDFIRDYLTLKTGNIPNKDNVYSAFKNYYCAAVSDTIENFLDELTQYGEYYSWFKYANGPDDKINFRLLQLQKLKSTIVYPFLLEMFEKYYKLHIIDLDTLCQTIDVILSYVMRRLICEMPTNALNKVFASMSKDISKLTVDSLPDQVAYVLSQKKGKVIFPNDEMIKNKLLTKDAYKFPHIKYILEQIERKQGKEIVGFEDMTIEHIMPQALTAKWKIDLGKKADEIHEKYLHCIGNLTLTGYNSELSNASFDEKRELLIKSNIYMNKMISEKNNWGEKEILERCSWIAKEIIQIWKCPDILSVNQDKVDNRIEFDIMDEVNVTGRTPVDIEICGGVIPVDSWKAFFQTICEQMYDYDAQIFRGLVKHNDFKGRNRRIIATTDEEMRRPCKLAEGVYIELNLSANDALNYSKLVVGNFNGMEDECSYRLKPNY